MLINNENSNRLITFHDDYYLTFYDKSTQQILESYQLKGTIENHQISQKNSKIFIQINDNSQGIIQRYNLITGQFEQETIINEPISCIKYSEIAETLYIGFQDGKTGKLNHKDLLVEERPELSHPISHVEIHEDVSIMITVTNEITLWDYK